MKLNYIILGQNQETQKCTFRVVGIVRSWYVCRHSTIGTLAKHTQTHRE